MFWRTTLDAGSLRDAQLLAQGGLARPAPAAASESPSSAAGAPLPPGLYVLALIIDPPLLL